MTEPDVPAPHGADRRRDTEYGPENHPNRREGDTTRGKLRALWRDVAPAIALVIAGVAVFAAGFAVLHTQSDVERQAEGRKITIAALCGFGNGSATAGRNVIEGKRADGTPIPGAVRSRAERKRRQAAGEAYVAQVVATVQQEAGVRNAPLKRDGTLNCDELEKKGHAATK